MKKIYTVTLWDYDGEWAGKYIVPAESEDEVAEIFDVGEDNFITSVDCVDVSDKFLTGDADHDTIVIETILKTMAESEDPR